MEVVELYFSGYRKGQVTPAPVNQMSRQKLLIFFVQPNLEVSSTHFFLRIMYVFIDIYIHICMRTTKIRRTARHMRIFSDLQNGAFIINAYIPIQACVNKVHHIYADLL